MLPAATWNRREPHPNHGQRGGSCRHGRVEHRRGPLTRFHNSYRQHPHGQRPANAAVGSDADRNLAHRNRAALFDGITTVLAGCVPLLKPDGVVAVVARPWRRDHFLVDLPGQTILAGVAAGLELVDCRRAIHAALCDGRLLPRHTFWQLNVARASRRKGLPVALIQHDDVAVFQQPMTTPPPPTHHQPSPTPADSFRPLQRAPWPHNRESRYGPAPLHTPATPNPSQTTSETDDHHNQHPDPDTYRTTTPTGRPR